MSGDPSKSPETVITNLQPLLPIVVQNEEPRVLDTDLAKRLGMNIPRRIRSDLIAPNQRELEAHCILEASTPNSGKAGRPAKVFYLNEQQALLICMFSRTEKAAAVSGLDRGKEGIDGYSAGD
ncbi:hypothetical protein [Rhizobium arsenicireducens]